MTVLLRALKELFPVLRLRAWLLSGMIILGVFAALSEGLSISLFIPLVQNQIGAPAFVDRFQHLSLHGAEERFEL